MRRKKLLKKSVKLQNNNIKKNIEDEFRKKRFRLKKIKKCEIRKLTIREFQKSKCTKNSTIDIIVINSVN